MHGLCVSTVLFTHHNVTTIRTLRKEWVKERVGIIGRGIFQARAVLVETPPTAPPTSRMNSSRTINQTWLSNVKAAIETAIGEEEIPYPTPNDAFQLYKGIYNQIMGQLKQVKPETEHGSGTADQTEKYV